MIEIGVFCHEYGHALGLPDLYDTDGGGEGIGYFGLMGAGSWGGNGQTPETPVQMCAWSKIYLGWLQPQTVAYDSIYPLPQAETAPAALKVWTGGTPGGEYFLVENRQLALNDRYLPAGGLHIWHIDETVIAANWYNNRINAGLIYGVALEQADGLDQLKTGANRGDGGDAWPGSTARTLFGGATLPSSRSNAGTSTSVVVRDIPTAASSMTPRVLVGVPPPPDLTAVGELVRPLRLGPGFPNPFNPSTVISFENPQPALVEIAVFDLVGRRVRTLLRDHLPVGRGSVRWDGRDDRGHELPSGVYHVQAVAGAGRSWVKVTLVR